MTAGQAGPARRRVLGASALAVLAAGAAGCAPGPYWPWARPPRPSPDVWVLRDAIGAEYAMISRYTAVLAAHPALTGTIAPVLAEHRAHLSQLRARLVIPPGTSAPESAAAAARPRLARPRVPPGQAAALGYLRAAEHDAAGALVRWLTSVPPSLAQLMASIGASEAAHAALLGPAGSAR